MSEPYTVGTTIRVTGTFRDVAGDLADPQTVTFKYRKPRESTITSLTYAGGGVTKDSTGVYHVDLSITDDGSWTYRWESTGTPATAAESSFAVSDSQFD